MVVKKNIRGQREREKIDFWGLRPNTRYDYERRRSAPSFFTSKVDSSESSVDGRLCTSPRAYST